MIKAASIVPVRKELTRADPSGQTWAMITPASYRQDMVRGEMLRNREYAVDDNYGVVTRVDVNIYRLHAEELWITYHSASIVLEDVDDDGKPANVDLFRPKDEMTRSEFMVALGRLPRPVVSEWHQALVSVVPDWQYPF